MFLVKLLFRSLWEIISIGLECSLPYVFMPVLAILLFVPFLFVIGIIVARPGILESFAVGYFGGRFIRSQRNRGWGRRFGFALLTILLNVALWFAGYYLTVFSARPLIPDDYYLMTAGFTGAVLFRRYVSRWIFAGFRSTPWVFRQLRAVF